MIGIRRSHLAKQSFRWTALLWLLCRALDPVTLFANPVGDEPTGATAVTPPSAEAVSNATLPAPVAAESSSNQVSSSVVSAAKTNFTPQDLALPPLVESPPAFATGADLLRSRSTTNVPLEKMSERERHEYFKQRLELARYLRTSRKAASAEPILIELLSDEVPDALQRSALLEIAAVTQDQNDPSRAVQIYAQFLSRWSDDLRAPEVLLRQGQLFRQMGVNNLALTKFYSVMTSALVLKNDQLEYYERLVLRAQMEIAETHYQLGKYAEAADYYKRLLKQNNPALDKSQAVYRLVRCTSAIERYDDAVGYAQDYLARFPEGPEQPEVRFYFAMALKQLGRNNESLHQVLTLLREQRERTLDQPAVWAYWQQRTGNLIANQLYREGDYPKALGIYLDLALLDASPEWQLPLWYQIGITYEKLLQPQKAVDTYSNILTREEASGTNASPGLKAIFDMARWRTNFIGWQNKAEAMNREMGTARQ